MEEAVYTLHLFFKHDFLRKQGEYEHPINQSVSLPINNFSTFWVILTTCDR